MTKHIVAIIQGRMGSSRLPGKILQDIGGQPMLARVVMRARRSKYLDQVVVASTLDPSDEPVEEFCRAKGFRSDWRHLIANKRYKPQASVRASPEVMTLHSS